ncbi:MAG: hypothetical protein ACRERV_09785, partial [Methylococcales bacterium]
MTKEAKMTKRQSDEKLIEWTQAGLVWREVFASVREPVRVEILAVWKCGERAFVRYCTNEG